MDLKAARNEIAAGIDADDLDVVGYARPPGQIARFPAAVVGDPSSIVYHGAAGRRVVVTIPVRVIVARTAVQDGTDLLDDLVSYDGLPTALEDIAGGSWEQLVVNELTGGYADFVQAGKPIGVTADLTCQLTFKPT